MNKADEVKHLASLIAQTPSESYLFGMLRHLLPQFEADMRSDLPTLPNIQEVEHEFTASILRLSTVQKELKEAEGQLRRAKEETARLKWQADDARAKLRDIGSHALSCSR